MRRFSSFFNSMREGTTETKSWDQLQVDLLRDLHLTRKIVAVNIFPNL